MDSGFAMHARRPEFKYLVLTKTKQNNENPSVSSQRLGLQEIGRSGRHVGLAEMAIFRLGERPCLKKINEGEEVIMEHP